MREVTEKGCAEGLKKLVDELAYPALLLDKDYRICYKNGFCLNRLIPLRMGSCIKKHLSSSDFRRIVQLKIGETIRLSLELPALYGVFVYRAEDCCMVGLRTLSAALQNRINELMKLNAELTESLLCQMSVLSAQNGEKGIAELVKHKSNRIIRAQQHISEFLRIVNGVKTARIRHCEIAPIIDSLLFSMRESLRPLGIQITYNNAPLTADSLSVSLCETDFNMIICLMLGNCIRITQGGKLQADVNIISGKLYISVMTDTLLPEKRAKSICESDLDEQSLFSPDGWLNFELLLLKKLCEYYFWDFRVTAPASDYSRIQMTLSLPLEKHNASTLTVRTRETTEEAVRGLLAVEFSDFFDR